MIYLYATQAIGAISFTSRYSESCLESIHPPSKLSAQSHDYLLDSGGSGGGREGGGGGEKGKFLTDYSRGCKF